MLHGVIFSKLVFLSTVLRIQIPVILTFIITKDLSS